MRLVLKLMKRYIPFMQPKTIVDYINLVPGSEYVLKGILMDKETGEPLVISGQKVTSEKTFTPVEAKGSVEIEFMFDSGVLKDKAVVVFENLYHENK